MYKIGTCGLPNAGKSTFLKAVSKAEIEIGNYPFTTKKPKTVITFVISDNLLNLHNITKTTEIIPAYLEFSDIPGLIKGSHKGLGLGNEFLSYLRACDVILEITRNFERVDVPHIEGEVNPQRDILIIEEEIMEADKKIIEEAIKKLEKTKKNQETLEILKNIYEKLEPFKRFEEYEEQLKEFNLLITKKWFLLINGNKTIALEQFKNLCFHNIYQLDCLFELELESDEEAKKEFGSNIQAFLNKFRQDIGLVEFFTFTKEITQSWFIERNSSILDCAQKIHSDFYNKFKSAEVISLKDFFNFKSWEEAKNKGAIKQVGKDYIIQEGDIIKITI